MRPTMKSRTLLACAAACVLTAPLAQPRITKVLIDPALSQSPAFGGYAWPGVGQYEKLAGRAFGEVNPAHAENAGIVHIGLAPRNSRGNVEYSFDFYILKPIDLSKGAHKVMYEPPNRGNKTWANIARFSGSTNDPASQTDAAILDNNFFLPRGYSVVFSGWDQAAGTSNANFVTTIDLS